MGSQQIHSEHKRCKSIFYLCSQCDLNTVSRGSRGLFYSVKFINEKKNEEGVHIIVKVAPSQSITYVILQNCQITESHNGMVGREQCVFADLGLPETSNLTTAMEI